MRRLYALAGVLGALLLLGLVWLTLSQRAGIGGALARLGKGERQFRVAREQLLLGTHDPGPALLQFVQNTKKSDRTRIHALRILADLAFHYDVPGAGANLTPLLREESPSLKLHALKALEALRALDTAGIVLSLFANETDTGLFQQSFRTLNAYATPLFTAMGDGIYGRDSAKVDSCLAALKGLPVGIGDLFPRLAWYYQTQGDISTATYYHRHSGLVRTWWLVGPFPLNSEAEWERGYAPEHQPFNQRDKFQADSRTTRVWTPVRRVNWNGVLRLDLICTVKENVVGYLFTYVHVPSERDALMFIGSDDKSMVWLNDSLVHTTLEMRPCIADDDVVRVRLRKGTNKLMAKVGQDAGDWALFCRFADRNGLGMPDVVSSLFPAHAPTVVDTLLDCVEAGGAMEKCAKGKSESLNPGDDEMCRRLVAAAIDGTASQKRRSAALQVLKAMNSGRSVPYGERDILQLATSLAGEHGTSKLLVEVVGVLADMRTSKGLDLGLQLRRTADKELVALGDRLVTAYCRSRLIPFRGRPDKSRANDALRMLHDLESLVPTDTGVVRRMAELYDLAEDTVKARRSWDRLKQLKG